MNEPDDPIKRLPATNFEVPESGRWANPKAQEAFGRALVRACAKYDDTSMQRLGWKERRAARRHVIDPGQTTNRINETVELLTTPPEESRMGISSEQSPGRVSPPHGGRVDQICGDLAILVLTLAMAAWVGETWRFRLVLRGGGSGAVAVAVAVAVLAVLATAAVIRLMRARREQFGMLALIVVVAAVVVVTFTAG